MDLLLEALAVLFDWLGPHGEDGPISRRQRVLRWACAVGATIIVIALVVGVMVATGGLGSL